MLQTIFSNLSTLALEASTSIDLSSVASPIVQLMNSILEPLIMVVGALGAVWCVLLGVKLAKADEPQEREKAKMALKNAIAGYVLIFVLVVVLRLTIGPLFKWMQGNKSTLEGTFILMRNFFNF
jgi:heme O synthase-like polyprenyltransferase